MRSVLLATALLIPSPVTNPLPMMFVQPESIVQVICFGTDNKGHRYIDSGTAFRIGPSGIGLSVNHVTSSGQCFISGKPLNLSYKLPKADFSEITLDEGPYLTIDCGGFVKGRKYLAVGFARGESPVTTVELTGTGQYDDGQAILTGMVPVIPGMSGGPIIDEETGRVVGVVNAENFEDGLSWSVPLSATPICKGAVA